MADTPSARVQIVPPPGDLDRALLVGALMLAALMLTLAIMPAHAPTMTLIAYLHDAPWLLIIAVSMILLTRLSGWRRVAALAEAWAPRWTLVTAILAATIVLVAIVGTSLVYHGFALSRDEAMAQFDAALFAHGRLIAPVPATWRAYVPAMEPLFLLPVRDNAGWVSSYLPVNAALRALFGLIASPTLAGPVLAGLALIALVGVARRLWPARPDAAIVAGLLLASSTQVLVTAMTPYAMTAHLTLDLVWLWLFVRDTNRSHAGAIAVGFLATGLHQLAFHTLFAAPFVASLWLTRRFRLAMLYTAAYAAIVLVWIAYWQIMLHANGLEGASSTQANAFAGKILDLIRAFNVTGIEVMLKNLARFATWQNPLMLPLALAALVNIRRLPPVVVCGAAGVALTLVVVFVILPFQGHGWGYRYLHGLLGSCALLATQGYVLLTTAASADTRRKIASQIALATGFSLLVMLPARAFEVEAFVAPFARAEDLIRHADSELVFVDPDGLPYAPDLVRNDPFLAKPLVFDLWALDEAQVRSLCAGHDVGVFEESNGHTLGFPLFSKNYVGGSKPLRAVMASIGCGRPIRRAAQP